MPLNRRETFSFPAEEYPDLAAWLNSKPQGQRSRAIAEALMLHVRRQVPVPVAIMAKLDQIVELIEELPAKIQEVRHELD